MSSSSFGLLDPPKQQHSRSQIPSDVLLQTKTQQQHQQHKRLTSQRGTSNAHPPTTKVAVSIREQTDVPTLSSSAAHATSSTSESAESP